MFTNIFNIAKANIKGGKKYPKINGAVTFREVKNGVLVTAKVNGLPQSSDSCTGRFFEIPNKPTDTHSSGSCIFFNVDITVIVFVKIGRCSIHFMIEVFIF